MKNYTTLKFVISIALVVQLEDQLNMNRKVAGSSLVRCYTYFSSEW